MNSHYWKTVLLFLALAACGHIQTSVADNQKDAVTIRHVMPPTDPIYSKGYSYFLDILHLAFAKADQPYILNPVEVRQVPDSRSMIFLKQGKYDVMWMHTNAERESELRPIRIPVFKGLVGWRIFLIKSNAVEFFDSFETDMLRVLYAGLGHDWPDVKIMESNGYAVRKAVNWRSVLGLLEQQRVDYFPRGINEIWREMGELSDPKIMVDKRFALHYLSANYLFLSKENEALAKVIERGLEKAVADGSFDKLFYSYFGNTIVRSNLGTREVIELQNPDLPTSTPIWRKELWLTRDDARKLTLRSSNENFSWQQ